MSLGLGETLKNRFVNGWNLFLLITLPISAIVLVAMMRTDLSNGEAVSSMIQLSVRWAVPWLYLAFAASSVQRLFPGPFGSWLLRNRKIMGLCFAAAMAWQAFFILWMVTVYKDYYVEEVYVLRDAIEGVVGYLFLIAMTITSFRWGRQLLKPKRWRQLHLSGMYFLWAYAFSVYWWALFYYPNPIWLDHLFYWSGFLAWILRAAAWRKKRRQQAAKKNPNDSPRAIFVAVGLAWIAFGCFAATFGLLWRESAEELLTGYAITRIPELYLPYWPFEPFLPLFVIALGVFLTTRSRA